VVGGQGLGQGELAGGRVGGRGRGDVGGGQEAGGRSAFRGGAGACGGPFPGENEGAPAGLAPHREAAVAAAVEVTQLVVPVAAELLVATAEAGAEIEGGRQSLQSVARGVPGRQAGSRIQRGLQACHQGVDAARKIAALLDALENVPGAEPQQQVIVGGAARGALGQAETGAAAETVVAVQIVGRIGAVAAGAGAAAAAAVLAAQGDAGGEEDGDGAALGVLRLGQDLAAVAAAHGELALAVPVEGRALGAVLEAADGVPQAFPAFILQHRQAQGFPRQEADHGGAGGAATGFGLAVVVGVGARQLAEDLAAVALVVGGGEAEQGFPGLGQGRHGGFRPDLGITG
ncbi:MAG: hypothetical protein DI538_31465, partial [Azospira oryzae]